MVFQKIRIFKIIIIYLIIITFKNKKNEDCILTELGLFRKPSEELLKPTNFESLLTKQDVFTCLKKEFISDSLNSRDIKEQFGCKEIS